MSDNDSIRVQNLTKTYRLYNSSLDRLKESLHPLRRQYHHDFFALNDVSFEIKKGESVGIIGKNGSGKSTLLKILTGVLTPTSGTVQVTGKVSALLELGAGFNPELSGMENVYFNGMLMGYTREEMDERLDDILSFADIGEFVHQPVKTYSSGMFVRLAFAVAVNVEPEIMIVDEALSVGDASFQQKCVKKMDGFKSNGGNIIFVSHDMNAIKVLCKRAILLDKGKMLEDGDSETVVSVYNSLIAGQQELYEKASGNKKVTYGNMKVEIVNVDILNKNGDSAEIIVSGENVTVKCVIYAHTTLEDLVVGIMVRDRFGQDIFGTNSYQLNKQLSICENQKLVFDFNIVMNLGVGKYTISLGAHSGHVHLDDNYHMCDAIKSFEIVSGNSNIIGLVNLQTRLEITKMLTQDNT